MGNQEGLNRGKDFEKVIRDSFEKVQFTLVERMPDPVQGYLGIRNKCDFIVYHFPCVYYIECKSTKSHLLPLSHITFNQRVGMLEASKVIGTVAGIICWFMSEDKTMFIPIQTIEKYRLNDIKSVNLKKLTKEDMKNDGIIEIPGKKKRVFFDYDLEEFINFCSAGYRGYKL